MKKALLILLLVGAGALILGVVRSKGGQETVNYRQVTVEQGDIEALVSATGTLDAVTTVQVGTQVSGIVDEICVDFNDPVQEGQVIARIDSREFEITLEESRYRHLQALSQMAAEARTLPKSTGMT